MAAGVCFFGGSSFKSQFSQDQKERSEEYQLTETPDSNQYLNQDNVEKRTLSAIQYEQPLPIGTSAEQLALSDIPDITIAFDHIELAEFVSHSLSNILKVNFVIAPQVKMEKKTVTLEIKEKISQRQFLSLFKDLLNQHALGMKIKEDIVFIHGDDSRNKRPDLDFGFGKADYDVPLGSQPIYHLVPINYIDLKSLRTFLIRLTAAGVELSYDPNVIALQGKRHDILRALSVIRMLDVPSLVGRKVMYIQMNYLPSGEFIETVTKLLENEGVNVSLGLRFTDLSRQNGVVVHSNNDALLKRVSYWQSKLDTPESTDDKQYFMYYPENMEASKLADILTKLVQVGGGSSNGGSASKNKSASTSLTNTNTSAGGNNSSGSRSQSVSATSKDFSFVSDENRNVIIIYATASKFKTMQPLLKKLDVTPPQVLIEAKLIEITLTDKFSQGIEWTLFGGGAQRNIPTSQRTSFNGGSFAYSISGIDYNAALNFLQNDDKLKVLSSPRIVVSNGESASLNVGTEIPVLTTQSTDVDSDRVLQSVQYRSTGVDLTVQPTVNSNSVVSLKISQNVSETSENSTSSLNSPIILNRSFDTSVIAHSGQTLVLGGLIRENNSSQTSKLPLLGDIPLIGRLFSNDSKSTTRTELLVLITPRIIQNSSDIEDIKNLFVDELTLFE